MFFPRNVDEVREALAFAERKNLKTFVLGNGSNVLFTKRFKGVIINMRGFDQMRLKGGELACGAGVNLFAFDRFCAENELEGLEFTYGIPGSVGGAVCMNAGAFGDEICKFLKKITVLKNGKLTEKTDFSFSYRNGPLKEGEILIEAVFELKSGKKEEILAKQIEFFTKKRNSQPYSLPSAGSVFKRKGDIIPAKLIDEWGLKGLRIGGAMISTEHAGFIVNCGNAKPNDVLSLIEIVEQIAKDKGYDFEREIKVL